MKEWIQENCEEKFKSFSEGLIAGREIKGVRIPKLRAFAKELVKERGLDALELLSDDCYEEVLLQGFVIAYSKELIELKEPFIYEYLCKCDNWSLVDSFSAIVKLKGIEKDIFYDIIKGWRNDEHEYVVRFTLVHCIVNYLDDEHIDDVLDFCGTLNDKAYSIKMANGWLLASAYINYSPKVRGLVKLLDDETFRITKGKIRDSYRISEEEKKLFVREK